VLASEEIGLKPGDCRVGAFDKNAEWHADQVFTIVKDATLDDYMRQLDEYGVRHLHVPFDGPVAFYYINTD
jgi:hypothetical protein